MNKEQALATAPLPCWSYTEILTNILSKTLNKYSAEGWELVQIIQQHPNAMYYYKIIMRK